VFVGVKRVISPGESGFLAGLFWRFFVKLDRLALS